MTHLGVYAASRRNQFGFAKPARSIIEDRW